MEGSRMKNSICRFCKKTDCEFRQPGLKECKHLELFPEEEPETVKLKHEMEVANKKQGIALLKEDIKRLRREYKENNRKLRRQKG